ncbi:MAG: protein kinase domain-containing protein [Trebonia sp.]
MEPLSANDPRMIGEFRLHSRLGAGGMGQVYLGFSPAGRAVAIKVIHSQFAADPEFLRRFSHEVTAARSVGGMYTAPVVDSSVTDSSPWLATAYVPGPPLATVVAKYGALPEATVWRLAAGLAEALRAVHTAGVIHRDLKPANVLLADDGPHVIDFGISRPFHGTQLTSAGMVIGTPGYMSPEQVESGPAGPASDIFSLGCVLAYAVTGSPPFGGEHLASVLYRIVSTEPDLSAIPPRLRQVIEACLKKDPAQRPGPAQVIAMINALGPERTATLGSFWPDDVARVIAAEQSTQTPSGLTPPGPASRVGSGSGATGAAGAGRMSGLTGAASPGPAPAHAERTPTALATPTPAQGASPTGHAPMLSDGYYAAAAHGRSGPAPAAPGPSTPPLSSPPRPYARPQPGGQATLGQASFAQPGLGIPPAYPGQAPPYPGQAPPYPGQQPGGGNAFPQYAPGRRKPMAAEVPGNVRNAITLMYIGFAVTVVDAVVSTAAFARYDYQVGVATAAGRTVVSDNANSMSGAIAVGMLADYLGLVCWIWLAIACRRGKGWPRVAGTVLLGIYALCALFVLFGTHRDPGPQFTTIVVLGIGVAAVIPLWSRQAREFFYAWRRR